MTDMEKMVSAFIHCGCPVERNGAASFTAAGRRYYFTEKGRTLIKVKDYITGEEHNGKEQVS